MLGLVPSEFIKVAPTLKQLNCILFTEIEAMTLMSVLIRKFIYAEWLALVSEF